MRYMLMIYSRETAEGPAPEDIEFMRTNHRSVMEETAAKGILVAVERLQPTVTATSVRILDRKPLITDGPFAETKEQLAGYYILDCLDLDEAIEWAKRIPTACQGREGCIEIRPIDYLPFRPAIPGTTGILFP
jgi:hypothetical protein